MHENKLIKLKYYINNRQQPSKDEYYVLYSTKHHPIFGSSKART